MKRIIKIDRPSRVAMIEPGVTFGELIPELGKEGLSPFMPLVPRRSKSVVASCLEREPITIPRAHWETQDPLLCTEIIYGSGDLFRTGSAAGPGTIEEQWETGRTQVRGMGPAQVDFAKLIQGAQGTMGIVTWVTVKCKLLPKVKKGFFVPSEDLDRLIDLTYRLMWKKVGAECLILNGHTLACILAKDAEKAIALREVLPNWALFLGIEGAGLLPNEKVAYEETELKEVAQLFGLTPQMVIPGATAEVVSDALSQPSPEPYWKLRYKGGCQDIFFITNLNRTPEFINKMNELAGRYKYPGIDIGVYIQPTVQGTNCHCEFHLSYSPQRSIEVDRMRNFFTAASKALADMGAFFSRPYGPWAAMGYSRAADTVIALRKVKNIFDPNGIMNPGKLCF
jgi:FAD/FMN-containing dehydrogenase